MSVPEFMRIRNIDDVDKYDRYGQLLADKYHLFFGRYTINHAKRTVTYLFNLEDPSMGRKPFRTEVNTITLIVDTDLVIEALKE